MPSIPELRPNTDGVYYAHWSDARRSKRKSMGTTDPAVAQERFAQWLLIRGQQSTESATTAYTIADCWLVYNTKHVHKGMQQARSAARAWKDADPDLGLAPTSLISRKEFASRGEKLTQEGLASAETQAYAWKNLEPHFGHLTPDQADQNTVDEYVEKRVNGRIGRRVKAATVRRELQVLFAILRFCAKKPQSMFAAKLIEKVELPPAGDPRDRWLTTDEMQRMLDAAARLRRGSKLSRGERFLWLALSTAGRMSAILDLTWDRVDFETRVIHLEVPGRKKTNKRRASVPISTSLLPVLERAYAERENALVMTNKADVWSTIQLIAIEAGFGGARPKTLRTEKPKATGISPHVLRHTAATHMARRGVPLWKIAKVLGNTLAMVEKVYSHHCPDDLREAVDLISNGALEAAE